MFEITVDEPEGCIVVATQSEPKCSVAIRMTSPAVRDEPGDSSEEQGLLLAFFNKFRQDQFDIHLSRWCSIYCNNACF